MVPSRVRRTCMLGQVRETWATSVGPNLGEEAMRQFLQLWQKIQDWEPMENIPDIISWSWEASGKFTVRSAYAARFWGREIIPTANITWKSRDPAMCKFFSWLALRNRCWTSDRLARRGLPHQDKCPLCDQEEETIEHVLLTCAFARTVWAGLCQALGKLDWTPT